MRAILVGLAVVLGSPFALIRAERPYSLALECGHVLVDRTHHWAFAHDDLGGKVLPPHGFQVVLSDASIDAVAKLRDFDVVFIAQYAGKVEFSAKEIKLLRDYVQEGGGLLLVGRPDAPIAEVANAFGLRMLDRRGVPPLHVASWLSNEFGADPIARTARVPYTIRPTEYGRPVILDRNGDPVAVIRTFGKGRVLLFTDDGTYWDFCAQRDANGNVPHCSITAAMFNCLAPSLSPSKPAPSSPIRIPAELEMKAGNLRLRYSRPLETRTRAHSAFIPRIAELVAQANGEMPPVDQFTVNMLAGSGGGWSSGSQVGIGCDGALDHNVKVIAHELTHCWAPLPGIFGEGWASLMGMRVANELGFRQSAVSERKFWQDRFKKADPSGKKLDITKSDQDRALFHACEGKAMWMIEQLETRFGTDFMRRFLEVRHALKPNQPVNLQEVLYYFSLTAGTDLNSWYQQLGVTYRPPPAISKEHLRERLEDYRRQVRRFKDDQMQLTAYQQMRNEFKEDAWRQEWHIANNLYATDNWIAEPGRVPENLAHVGLPPAERRAGFLVIHARSRDKPCRLERTLDVPRNGETRLYVGCAKRLGGGPTALRLAVNEEIVWSRYLDTENWFHASVDLSEYAGQQVALRLESDTQGEWGSREVLIDYLTVLNKP